MTRKKLIALVASGVGVFYIVTLAVSFLLIVQVQRTNGRYRDEKTNGAYAQNTLISASRLAGMEGVLAALSIDYNYASAPYTFALFDAQGNLVYRRSHTLLAVDRQDRILFNGDIDSFLTDENKKRIAAFKNHCPLGAMEVQEASFYARGDGTLLPTEIVFYDASDASKTLAVPLVMFETHFTLINREDADLFAAAYDFGGTASDRRCYAQLDAMVDELAAQADAVDWSAPGSAVFSAAEQNRSRVFPDTLDWTFEEVMLGQKVYRYFCAVMYNPYYDAAVSADFRYVALAELAFFGVVGGLLTLIAVRLFRKSKLLDETARAFTAASAHELKTPLAVIQNQCECIMEAVAPEKNAQYVQSVYQEALRMHGMVNTMLQYNRLANMTAVSKELCDPGEIVKAEAARYQSFAQSKGVALTAHIASQTRVAGNAELLRLAVDNYLSNAIKYASGERRVTVSLARARGRCECRVYNDGDAILAGDGKRIWRVLARADAARSGETAAGGMGLPICARIFQLHRFRYGYRNVDGGVEFYFSFREI